MADNAYITSAQLRDYVKDDSNFDQATYDLACLTASRRIDALCDRTFFDVVTPSVKYYEPDDYLECEVDDFSTTVGLVVAIDWGYDGTYSTTFTMGTHYQAEPVNQAKGGLDWAYESLRIVGYNAYWPPPSTVRRQTVKVTARWGWTAVPDSIVLATLIAAADDVTHAPFGIAGFDQYGAVRVRDNPRVLRACGPYMMAPVATA